MAGSTARGPPNAGRLMSLEHRGQRKCHGIDRYPLSMIQVDGVGDH